MSKGKGKGKGKEARLLCLLYIIVIILTGWVCYTSYCDLYFDAENAAGIYISALGVLITFVVAWQIYNAVDMRGEIKNFKSEIDSLRNITQEHEAKAGERLSKVETSTAILQNAFNTPHIDSILSNEIAGNIHLCLAHTMGELAKPFDSYLEFFKALYCFSSSHDGKHLAEMGLILDNLETLLETFECNNEDFSKQGVKLLDMAELFTNIKRNLNKIDLEIVNFIGRMADIEKRHNACIKK